MPAAAPAFVDDDASLYDVPEEGEFQDLGDAMLSLPPDEPAVVAQPAEAGLKHDVPAVDSGAVDESCCFGVPNQRVI